MRHPDISVPDDPDARSSHRLQSPGGGGTLKFLYFLAVVGTIPTLVLFEIARIRPLYPLPLRTRQIVNLQLGIGLAGVVGIYLFTVAYYQLVFSATIPVLGPMMFLIPGLLIGAGLAGLLIDARWWKLLLFLAAMGSAVYWITHRFDEPVLEAAGREWFSPSPVELVWLIGLSMIGYGVAMHTTRLDRRGDTRSWAVLEEYLYRFIGWVTKSLPTRLPSLSISSPSSPTAAQFAFDWLTKGLVLPILIAFFGTLSLIGAYFEPFEWFRNYTIAIPVMLMIGMALNGYFVGLMTGQDAKGPMDRYRATRPLSDWQLAASAMKTGLASTLAALLISLSLAGLVFVYASLCGHSSRLLFTHLFNGSGELFREGLSFYAGSFLALAILGWAGMGFNLTCVSTGRNLIVACIWMGGVGLMILNIVLERQLPSEQYQQLAQFAVTGFAVLAVGVTIYSYQQVISRGLVPRWALPAGIILGLLAVGLLWVVSREEMTASPMWPAAAIGLTALVALPFASAPLAIAWNRHR